MKNIVLNPILIDIEVSGEWEFIKPKRGDHIRVQRSGIYSHHGIYISDEEVIHFTGTDDDSILDWSKCEVICTDITQFLRGDSVEVKVYSQDELNDLYPVEHIVNFARICLGDKGYNLVFNNCEHFANICTLGRFRSQQVERVLSGKLPLEEENYMILSGFFKSIFGGNGSRSASNTTYEPDKVKIAEIEADNRIRLAGMENDRIELIKQAQLDVLHYETDVQIALEQAKAQGLAYKVQAIIAMQEKLNEVAEKRLLIVEKASLQVVNEIEMFYSEIIMKIENDRDNYNMVKLPELLSVLSKYEEGSYAHSIYMKQIEKDGDMQSKYIMQQLEDILQRQKQITDGFIASKKQIVEHTSKITEGILETIEKDTLEFGTSKSIVSENTKKIFSDVENLRLEGKTE